MVLLLPFFLVSQLATGTGIAPFRAFLWKMFFEKHDDYKVCKGCLKRSSDSCQIYSLISELVSALACSLMVWHGSSWVYPQAALSCTRM